MNFIHELMSAMNVKQREIAETLGVSPAMVSEWKKSNSLPSERQAQLEKEFDFSADRVEWSWLGKHYESHREAATKFLNYWINADEYGPKSSLAGDLSEGYGGAEIYRAILELGVPTELLLRVISTAQDEDGEEEEAENEPETDVLKLRGLLISLIMHVGNASAWWDRYLDPLFETDIDTYDRAASLPSHPVCVLFLSSSSQDELISLGCSSETVSRAGRVAKQELTQEIKVVLKAYLEAPVSPLISDPYVLLEGSEGAVLHELEAIDWEGTIIPEDRSLESMLPLKDRLILRQLKLQGKLINVLANELIREKKLNPEQETLELITELFKAIDRDFD